MKHGSLLLMGYRLSDNEVEDRNCSCPLLTRVGAIFVGRIIIERLCWNGDAADG